MKLNSTEIKDLAKKGADSVFEYIERTAKNMDNGIRWLTKSYSNKPQYSNILFDGVSGISLFLSDYYRLTGLTSSYELAKGAIEWSVNQDIEGDGLLTGKAGIGLAYLRLAMASDESLILKEAIKMGNEIQENNFGPVNDILSGVSGIGLFLCKLAEKTQDEKHLNKAISCGKWMEKHLKKAEYGYYWSMFNEGERNVNPSGFGHGIAGDAYFLILLYKLTGDIRWKNLTEKIINTLDNLALPDKGGLNWSADLGGTELKYCQWCHGSPGIGIFYAKAYEVFGEANYLKTAELAGETTYNSGDIRKNPSQCHGLSGNAELFIDLYHLTKNELWLERAYEFAKIIFSYQEESSEGVIWQADKAGFYSPDYWCGAAGAGHFFLRLWSGQKLERPLE